MKVKSSLEFSASSFFQEKDEGLRQEKRVYYNILVGAGNIMLMSIENFVKTFTPPEFSLLNELTFY